MLRLGLWQGAGVQGNLRATVREAGRIVAHASKEAADLVVFPEGYLTGYYIPGLTGDDLRNVDEAIAEVGRIAAGAGVAIVMGTHLLSSEGMRNAAVAFSADGAELGRYYKRMLFGGWEKDTFIPGAQTLRFDCGEMRVGVLICYDVEFPELVRDEARDGVDIVVVPTALMAPHDRIARQMVPVRAMENQIYLGYANRTGSESELDFVGLSSINDPQGAALASADEAPKLLLADLDPKIPERERAESCYIDDLLLFRGR